MTMMTTKPTLIPPPPLPRPGRSPWRPGTGGDVRGWRWRLPSGGELWGRRAVLRRRLQAHTHACLHPTISSALDHWDASSSTISYLQLPSPFVPSASSTASSRRKEKPPFLGARDYRLPQPLPPGGGGWPRLHTRPTHSNYNPASYAHQFSRNDAYHSLESSGWSTPEPSQKICSHHHKRPHHRSAPQPHSRPLVLHHHHHRSSAAATHTHSSVRVRLLPEQTYDPVLPNNWRHGLHPHLGQVSRRSRAAASAAHSPTHLLPQPRPRWGGRQRRVTTWWRLATPDQHQHAITISDRHLPFPTPSHLPHRLSHVLLAPARSLAIT